MSDFADCMDKISKMFTDHKAIMYDTFTMVDKNMNIDNAKS